MNKEVQSIISNLERVMSGQPWFGRPVYSIMEETDPAKVSIQPGKSGHSLLELLYHMITWADFTLKSLEADEKTDITAIEKMDWRTIDPSLHSWKKGMEDFKSIHEKIIQLLNKKDDTFLPEMVRHRQYNFRFLLNGLIQHNIYHLGQIAYINKFLV
jgi:uncharacterized damage-inducible protein DinB